MGSLFKVEMTTLGSPPSGMVWLSWFTLLSRFSYRWERSLLNETIASLRERLWFMPPFLLFVCTQKYKGIAAVRLIGLHDKRREVVWPSLTGSLFASFELVLFAEFSVHRLYESWMRWSECNFKYQQKLSLSRTPQWSNKDCRVVTPQLKINLYLLPG